MIKLLEILKIPQLYIGNSKIHGKGLFTKDDIEKGTKILLATNFNNGTVTNFGKYINHIENSNCIVKMSNNLAFLIAKNDISSDEELTVDYKTLPDKRFNKNIDGFKNELNELEITHPYEFNENWVKSNLIQIMDKTGLENINPKGNELDWWQEEQEDENGEYYNIIFVTRSKYDCEGLAISDNLSLMDENNSLEGPGSTWEITQIKGKKIVVREIGC